MFRRAYMVLLRNKCMKNNCMRVLVVISLIIMASGCLGFSNTGEGTISEVATTSELDETRSSNYSDHFPLFSGDRLVIHNNYSGTIMVEMTRLKDNHIVHKRKYTKRGDINLSEEFSSGVDYQVKISVNNKTELNESIYSYEVYGILVANNGTVNVISKLEY